MDDTEDLPEHDDDDEDDETFSLGSLNEDENGNLYENTDSEEEDEGNFNMFVLE